MRAIGIQTPAPRHRRPIWHGGIHDWSPEQLTQKARLEATREMLTKQLHWRFDHVPMTFLGRVENAEKVELESWAERLTKGATLDEIFA